MTVIFHEHGSKAEPIKYPGYNYSSSRHATDILLSLPPHNFEVIKNKIFNLMKFASIRIITDDIKTLVSFYEKITGLPVIQYTDDFAELRFPTFVLAIGSTRTLQLFGGSDMAAPAANRSVILEFKVNDVDAEFDRLKQYLGDGIVQIPTTMPWGNRSMLFRDTDGNLVNFFTPVTEKVN